MVKWLHSVWEVISLSQALAYERNGKHKIFITSSWQLLTRDENTNFLLYFVEISETVQFIMGKPIPTPEKQISKHRQTKKMGLFFTGIGHAVPKDVGHVLL